MISQVQSIKRQSNIFPKFMKSVYYQKYFIIVIWYLIDTLTIKDVLAYNMVVIIQTMEVVF